MHAERLIKWRKNLWKEKKSVELDRQWRDAAAEELLADENLRQEIYEKPEYLIELFFVIVDKKKNILPFFFNEVQKDFIRRYNKALDDYRKGKLAKIQFLILKGRQQGFTSLITAIQLARCICTPNFEGFTLADVTENATAIFENKAKYPHSQLPEALKPTEKFNNKKELRFSRLNSSWEVGTATENVGRSRTINFLHCSEAAFFKVLMSDLQAAIGPAMTGDCVTIYESTANGFNDFKDMWDSGNYINCFYEWWRSAEYTQKFESRAKKEEFYDTVKNGNTWIADRLRWLFDKGIKEGQVYWYYVTYQNYQDKEKIKQEYPCTPEEAFLMSGRPVFAVENIVNRIAELRKKYQKKPYREGYFKFKWHNAKTKDYIIDDSIKFVDSHQKNWIRIYEEPQPKNPYVIGGDTKGEGSDFYAMTVINNHTGNRAASMDINIMTSSPYTYQLYCACRYVNDALIGVEINFNTGPIEELQRLSYPRQYVRRKFDDYRKVREEKYGFKTDGNSRPLIIDKEGDVVLNEIDLLNDIPTLEQMLTFIYDDKGRPDAMEGKHDDLLFSEMIANQIREQQTHLLDGEEKKKGHYTEDMLEDYNNASPEERIEMEKLWGEP